MSRHLHWYVVLVILVIGFFISTLITSTGQARVTTPAPPIVLTPGSTAVSSNTSWTMTAVGDIMFDRSVRQLVTSKGYDYPFQLIAKQLAGDIVLANLEGPITPKPSVATNTHLVFTFDPKSAPALKKAGFTTLSLANNHTLNFGQTGLTQTRQFLQTAGLQFFGDPLNRTEFQFTKTINGRPVTFLGYIGLVSGLDTIVSDVQRVHARGDLVIVMAHGGTEYNLQFTSKQQSDYRRLIDAGADMVIAAHPHVVEPLEIYKNKLIVYSLGNFLFDQYFSSDTQQGLMLNLAFGQQLTVRLIPLDLTKNQPKIASASLAQKLLTRLATTSVGTKTQQAMIQSGILTLPAP